MIEREETGVPWHPQIMPWARAQEDDHRFRRTLLASAAICLLLGVVLPYIDIPLPERDEVVEAPERLARLIRKETPRPMPTPRKELEEQQVAEKPREVEPVVPPETVPEVAPKVLPEPVPENQVAAASGGQRAPAGLLYYDNADFGQKLKALMEGKK